MFRFGIVGVTALCTTIGLYALLTRWIWPNGPRPVIYGIVTVFVTWLNYELNRHFTFRAGRRTVGNMGRFVVVAVVALGLNNGLFYVGHAILHLYDLWVIVGVTLIVAVFTFTAHRFFTFHPEPFRFFRRRTLSPPEGG